MTDPGSCVPVARTAGCRGPQPWHLRLRGRLLPRAPALQPVLIAAALAAAYLIAAPVSADLAAQTYRAGLFDRAGWLLWDNAWYGGHPLPGYSVLFPPLGALLGVRLVGALSVVVAAALFAALVRGAFPARRAAVGAAWFAAAVAAQLLTGRITFLLGVALALAALLAARRRSTAIAVILAALTTLASPVAGAFLALAGAAWAAGARRGTGAALAAAAVVPGLVLAAFFPEGGVEPFVPSAFWPAFAALALIAALLPAEQRVLRAGAAMAAATCLLAFALATPLGGNAARLGALFAGPLLACVPLSGRRRTIVLAGVPLLVYWQLMPPVRDAIVVAGDPSTHAAYYAPLAAELARRAPGRVEVPFTRSHWEARHLAERVPLARGWQRQLDRERNALFYEGRLTAQRLRRWLRANAVRWVALPDAALDPSARAEAALLRGGVPGVRQVWRDRHWRLFAVAGAPDLAQGAARLVALGPDRFTLDARRAGAA
ncbi:MAG TPA: hypothetical protein VGJ32_09875, partial [Solirubrobacteraceae bacterium]